MNLSERNRKVAISRWEKIHSKVRIKNNLSKEKIAINAYLCGDGNIKIRKKGFYYEIRFYMDDLSVSKRIVDLFKKEFEITPKIRKMKSKVPNGRGYYKIEICNRPACENLLEIGKYGSLDWEIPQKLNKELKKEWVKCFFDCEAHVNLHRKQIQVKSINSEGLSNVKSILEDFGISSKIYGPYKQKKEQHNDYSLLTILRKEGIRKYAKLIGFYHSHKTKSLKRII